MATMAKGQDRAEQVGRLSTGPADARESEN
jgi:hypothetical protein